ncbi:MAG: hypothetical protein ACFFFH_18545 [Candidatus Thorarchaeota archaeon]
MLEIHLYGIFRKKFKPNASFAEDTIISLPNFKNEHFQNLLERLGLRVKECGDCFINGRLANQDTIIPENARIGLFPFGMHLLDGGQHIKGHGFVTTNPFNDL